MKKYQKIVKKCGTDGIENIFVSGLLQKTPIITEDIIRRVNKLKILVKQKGVFMFLMIT